MSSCTLISHDGDDESHNSRSFNSEYARIQRCMMSLFCDAVYDVDDDDDDDEDDDDDDDVDDESSDVG